jgi:hypothetical protein
MRGGRERAQQGCERAAAERDRHGFVSSTDMAVGQYFPPARFGKPARFVD